MKKHHATLLAPVTASQSVPPPPPRVGASLVLLGEFLVLFGGAAHETGAQGGVLRLSAHSRTWAPLPSLPHPRYDHLALAVARAPVNAASGAKRSHMLVFGGAGNDGNLNDLWFLDADSLDWINSTKRMKGSVPSPRTIQSCAYLPGDESTADRIFIYGGGEGGGKATDDTRIHCLDIDTLTWTHVKTVSAPPPPPLQGHSTSLVEVNSAPCILIYGGSSVAETSTTSVYIFNLPTNTWSHHDPPSLDDASAWPKSRFGHTMTCVYSARHSRNVFVIVGGLHKSDEGVLEVLEDVWILDVTENADGGVVCNWEQLEVVEAVVGGGSSGEKSGFGLSIDAAACAIPANVPIASMDVCGTDVDILDGNAPSPATTAQAAENVKLITGGGTAEEVGGHMSQEKQTQAVLLFGGMDLRSLSNRVSVLLV